MNLTVKILRDIISELPDDTLVLTPGGDHSYCPAHALPATALKSSRNQWTEDHGEEITPEKEYGKRVKVLVIS